MTLGLSVTTTQFLFLHRPYLCNWSHQCLIWFMSQTTPDQIGQNQNKSFFFLKKTWTYPVYGGRWCAHALTFRDNISDISGFFSIFYIAPLTAQSPTSPLIAQSHKPTQPSTRSKGLKSRLGYHLANTSFVNIYSI